MSRGFRFRLDAALQQRARQEQTLQIALANALQIQTSVQYALDQMRRQLAAAQQDTTAPGSVFGLEQRMHLLLHVDRANRHVHQQQLLVQQRAQEVQSVHQQLIQASARRRALERLREHQQEEYARDQQRRENNELDEQGTLRYARPGVERRELDASITEY